MTPLVPFMLFGWIPISTIAFFKLKPHRAVLFTIIGGSLFLPQAGFDISGFPNYTKTMAIATSLILGAWFSGKRKASSFRWTLYDLPLFIYCFTPVISSLDNQLGLYNGFSGMVTNFLFLAVPFIFGRMYFNSLDSLCDICLGLFIGGLIYVPLCLFEIRMSPQLSNIFYGFFPHSFLQHVRYGGFRPIVFMSHGLQVALWMANASIVAFWFWRSGKIKNFNGIPMSLLVVFLIGTTILCKSANGWFVVITGCSFFYIYRKWKTNGIFLLLLVTILLYPGLRIAGVVSTENVQKVASVLFDTERVNSLKMRLLQEELFIEKTMEKPLLGWNVSEERMPRNANGTLAVPMIDSIWLIFFNTGGFVGLYSFYSIMLIGAWLTLRTSRKRFSLTDEQVMVPIVLSLGVVFVMLDSLVNAMSNPVYFMISGALVSFHIHKKSNSAISH